MGLQVDGPYFWQDLHLLFNCLPSDHVQGYSSVKLIAKKNRRNKSAKEVAQSNDIPNRSMINNPPKQKCPNAPASHPSNIEVPN